MILKVMFDFCLNKLGFDYIPFGFRDVIERLVTVVLCCRPVLFLHLHQYAPSTKKNHDFLSEIMISGSLSLDLFLVEPGRFNN